ncbi:MAG TPA: IPT/TIG domain-containing protein [Solirubrobacteraceae bacterium]|nr:IPT/TIG domain-containing protein [Solirubrobacteraceae bacterium]
MDVPIGGGRALAAALALAALWTVLAWGGACAPASAHKVREAGSARVCAAARAPAASCTAVRLDASSLSRRELRAAAARQAAERAAGVRPAVTYKEPFPGYLTPQLLHAAYSLPYEGSSSAAQTIAVVDAFDDPTAEADLAVYDEQFGLPACTTANGCFRKLDEQGRASPLPQEDGEWASEISIDVQMAHAICEGCDVLLVEASSEEMSDLGAAVNTAVQAGATEISNSYATPEEAGLASYFTELAAADYEHPGVVITAASGDCGYLDEECIGAPGAANFPADSPAVVAVGGTELTSKNGKWASTVWKGSGGGCSALFATPPWQEAAAGYEATGCAGARSLVDVAAVGDPSTGVDVYDSTPEGSGEPTGWGVWGGTSVASPIVAAEFALAGGAHGVGYPAATLYSHLGEAGSLYDVTSGANGSCSTSSCEARSGFDGPSGVGSPLGLGAFAVSGAPVNVSPPAISGVAEEGQTLVAQPGRWTNAPTSTGYQWLRCKGGSCAAIAGATAGDYELGAQDVGATMVLRESAANADGQGVPADSQPTATVAGDALSLLRFSPKSGITGSTVTIYGTGLRNATGVQFGSLAAQFTVLSGTEAQAVVPDGARSGKLTVATPTGSVKGKAKFQVTFSITSFSPRSAGAGATVTIKGVGFSKGSSVSFDGVGATVVSASAKKIKAVVPAGAGEGPISVSNEAAPAGTVYSAEDFRP